MVSSNLLIAAIDVGSSAIRMDIAEVRADGSLRTLDALSKGVSLGRDSFTTGRLSEEVIQTACQALADFQRMLKAYGINKYRAVATSAVREASNADTFLDRAYMRSGIDIDVIDGSEENRLTYIAIDAALRGVLDLQAINALILEVGGGSTDISYLRSSEPIYSGTFSLGAVRLQQSLHAVRGDGKARVRVLEREIKSIVEVMAKNIPFQQTDEVVALGGDIRSAARQISGELPAGQQDYWVIEKKDFHRFCAEIVRADSDELIRRYGYPKAETVVPSLLAYRQILDRTKIERMYVLGTHIRTGILRDMANRELGLGVEGLERQIVASARALAQKYQANENHLEQVRQISLSLFDQLQYEHGLDRRERLLLEVAAILHEVGAFISNRAHHKHSYYVIASSEIFGLSRADMNLVANIARYHRRSMPNSSHPAYTSLDRESRMIVSKLAAILRVADALERENSSKIHNVRLTRDDEGGRYILEVDADAGDLAVENMSLQRKGDLFQSIYGKPIVLRTADRLE